MFRAVDLHQLAQTIAPSARLMRGGQLVATVEPQAHSDHPLPQRLARDRATMQLGQLLSGQRRTEISVAFAHQRQRQVAKWLRQPVIAGFATTSRDQADGATTLQPGKQTENLASLQTQQFARVRHPDPSGLNASQNLKPVEFLLAHRHHRHDPYRGPLKTGGGVISTWRRGAI